MSRPSGTHVSNRLRILSLNSPPQTSLFYARLYNALCPLENDHESLHILALCFMEVNEPYSALHAVRDRAEGGCTSCAMILARCCQKLGRYTEGQAVLQRALRRGSSVICKLFWPYSGSIADQAALPTLDVHGSPADAYLTSATLSHKGKVTATAFENYKKALLEDPWSWESFTGLCALGACPPPNA
jgi:anaphase-promoting complex subunit 3